MPDAKRAPIRFSFKWWSGTDVKEKISLISGLTICAVVFLQLALLEIFYSARRLDFVMTSETLT